MIREISLPNLYRETNERTAMKDLTFEDGRANDMGRAEDNKVYSVTRSLNNLVTTSACTLVGCTMGKTNYMLECSNCKRLTHYSCIKLPAVHAKGLQVI